MEFLSYYLHKMTKNFRIFFHDREDLSTFGIRINIVAVSDAAILSRWASQSSENRSMHPYVLHTANLGNAEILHTAGGWRKIQTGNCWLVRPGEPVNYRAISDDFRHTLVSFDIEHSLPTGNRFTLSRCLVPSKGDRIANRLFDELVSHAQSGKTARERKLPGLLHQILDDLFPDLPAVAGQRCSPELMRLVEQIRARPESAWDFPSEARKLGMSYSLFRQKIRAVTGRPCQQLLIQARINHACRHLSEGLPVQEAGARVGIPDPYYFSRLFKQNMGVAPRDYRSL